MSRFFMTFFLNFIVILHRAVLQMINSQFSMKASTHEIFLPFQTIRPRAIPVKAPPEELVKFVSQKFLVGSPAIPQHRAGTVRATQ
jgi:hypothetical protein